MYEDIERLRIQLNSLLEDYRQQQKIPSYVITGILQEEVAAFRNYELAEYYIQKTQEVRNDGSDNKD